MAAYGIQVSLWRSSLEICLQPKFNPPKKCGRKLLVEDQPVILKGKKPALNQSKS